MKDKAAGAGRLFLFMAVGIIAFILWGGGFFGKLSVPGQLVGTQLIYLTPVVIFLFLYRGRLGEWIPHGRIRLSTVLMTVLFSVLLLPLMLTLNVFTMLFSNNYVVQMDESMGDISLALKLLTVAVIPAVSEEFMFRGVFFGAYREKGIFTAALGCGLIFGALHLNFNQFAYALMLGIAFGFLLEATGSIFYCMIGHFIINGWSVFLSAISEPLLKWAESVSGQQSQTAQTLTQVDLVNAFCVYAPVAAVTACLALAVLIWIAKHSGRISYLRNHWKGEKTETGEGRFWFTPAFWLAILVCGGFMVFRDLLYAGLQ